MKENAQSYHFFDSSDALGTLAASTGDHERAVVYFNALSQSPMPADKIKAKYYAGSSNIAIGKVAEARTAFNEAIATNADDANAKRYQKLAAVGLIRCETAEKKFDAAIEKLRKLVSDSDATDGELFARIYNALGEAHLQAGQEEEALLAFLHTDLLFTNDPRAMPKLCTIWSNCSPSSTVSRCRSQSPTTINVFELGLGQENIAIRSPHSTFFSSGAFRDMSDTFVPSICCSPSKRWLGFGSRSWLAGLLMAFVLQLSMSSYSSSQALAQEDPAAAAAPAPTKSSESMLVSTWKALGAKYAISFLIMSFLLVAVLVMLILAFGKTVLFPPIWCKASTRV